MLQRLLCMRRCDGLLLLLDGACGRVRVLRLRLHRRRHGRGGHGRLVEVVGELLLVLGVHLRRDVERKVDEEQELELERVHFVARDAAHLRVVRVIKVLVVEELGREHDTASQIQKQECKWEFQVVEINMRTPSASECFGHAPCYYYPMHVQRVDHEILALYQPIDVDEREHETLSTA